MLRKLMALAASAALAFGFTACSSFETATRLNEQKLTLNENVESISHINTRIWGMYLFGTLPIATGSASTPNKCSFFQDNVTVNNAVNLLTASSKNNLDSKYVIDLQSETTRIWLLPPLFSYKSVQVSGNALK